MSSDRVTDPPPPSDPEDRLSYSDLSAAKHAQLVADSVQLRLQPLYTKVDKTTSAVKTLADAFAEHTSDENKRHAAMLKVFAIRSVMLPVTFAIAVAALALWFFSNPAQADATVCSPQVADAGGP